MHFEKIHLIRMHLKLDKLENAKCISWKYINQKIYLKCIFSSPFW